MAALIRMAIPRRALTRARRAYGAGPAEHGRDEEYARYLEAVDMSKNIMTDRNASMDEGSAQNRGTDQDKRRDALFFNIREVISGADGVLIKLRRLNEALFLAMDSGLSIDTRLFHTVCVFLSSFDPFPTAAEVGYVRHELVMKIYHHMKERGQYLTDETVADVVYCLSKTGSGRQSGKSRLAECRGVMNDARNAGVTLSSKVWTQYYRLVSVGGDRTDMEHAYNEHEAMWAGDVPYSNCPFLFSALLNALVHFDMIAEALKIINRWDTLPVTPVLAVNAMHVCVKSPDPMAAFSMYEVMFCKPSTLLPPLRAFTLLLYAAAQRSGGMQPQDVVRVVNAMRYHQIRTDDARFLNRLCVSLLAVKQNDSALDLYKSMKRRGIEIFSVTKESLPPDAVEIEEEARILGHGIQEAPPTAAVVQQKSDDAAAADPSLKEWRPENSHRPRRSDEGLSQWMEKGMMKGRRHEERVEMEKGLKVWSEKLVGAGAVQRVREVSLRVSPKVSPLSRKDAAAKREDNRLRQTASSLRAMEEPEFLNADDKDAEDGDGYDVGMLLGL